MRGILLLFVIGGLVTFGAAAASSTVILTSEDNGRLTLEARFDAKAIRGVGTRGVVQTPGLPALRYERFIVALPPEAVYRISAVGGSFTDGRGELPAIVENPDAPHFPTAVLPASGFYPSSPVVVSRPYTFRNVRVIAVDCYDSQVDFSTGVLRRWSEYGVSVIYTPAASFCPAEEADPLIADRVVNRTFVPAPGERRGTAVGARSPQDGLDLPDPHFSLSSNWVKITVDSAGVYAVDGNDLLRIGVDPSAVEDPESFRLFTRGGRQLERRDEMGMPFSDADGTWRAGQWMTECDILVEGAQDGVFHPSDRIVFYGVGTHGWADAADPGASAHAYEDHAYAGENAYFLTWDDSPGFPGSPGRMAPVNAAPPVGGPDVVSFEERVFVERNFIEAYTFGGDGFQWVDVAPRTGAETVTLTTLPVYDLVGTRPQIFYTIPLARTTYGENNSNHHAEYLVNDVKIGEAVFNSVEHFDRAAPYQTSGFFLREGANTVKLRLPRDLNPRDFMYFDWFEMFYSRELRGRGNRLHFGVRDTTGAVSFQLASFAAGEPIYLLDVSDSFHPRVLTGLETVENGGRLNARFSYAMTGDPASFAAASASALKDPRRMARRFPRDLRNVATSPHMLIVCHPSMKSAADRLKAHRSSHYPYDYAPAIEVATTEEVFENFSGGIADPMGIRNYCKFLYDNFKDGHGYPLLTFLLLLGDANVDAKNYITTQENLVTTNLNLKPYNSDAYATDDWFAELEPPDSLRSYLQIAVGRLPAASVTDAVFLVDRVIDYETRAGYGPWRNQVILVSDDEVAPNRIEPIFTVQTESIATAFMAPYLEPVKIYLTEYPLIGSTKPASRLEFIEKWNDGGLIINYVGHGSSAQMADEQVFRGDDVAMLRNGLKLPLFMAFSCTIGDFGRAQSVSLAEKLVLWREGGAIAAVTASEVTYISPNGYINTGLFEELSSREPGPSPPVGVALARAKSEFIATIRMHDPWTRADSANVFSSEQNNHKYNLLGDPSLALISPRREIQLSQGDVDSLVAGKRERIRGTVLRDGVADPSFNGRVDLVLREPDDQSGYMSADGLTFIPYRYPGGVIYRGTSDVTAGGFEFNVKIPRSALTGPRAFVRAYADDGFSSDAIALFDRSYVVEPSPGDTTVLKPLDGAPRVELGFEGGRTLVKPGVELQANIRDADGINVLNTTPEGKIAIVFDDTNLPVDVTDSFEFDHGGTDTSGVLRFGLPSLALGPHRLILKVADSFGLVRLDTLGFTMVDEQQYLAEVVFNYPNPFETTTHFLLNLTDPAEVHVDVFTVTGKKIRTLRETKSAGQAWIFWDGKDFAGDSIANGTYIYVARVSFLDLDRPPVVLRGKVVKID